MPKRNDRVAPPVLPGSWKFVHHETAAMHGWEDLCGRYATTTSECFMHVTTDPRDRTRNASRIARLRGELGTRSVGGRKLEQWQYEVGGGARVWYAIDDTTKTVYLTHAGIGHPKATE